MESRFVHNPQTFVGVVASGTYVFVGIEKREDFDKIAVPHFDGGENDKGHCLIKTVENGGVTVVFQYWIKSLTAEAFIADCRAERAAAKNTTGD